jgi:hypothetical protein
MSRNPKPWPWPDSLDALAAAPAHHELLLEDQRVRVLQTRIPAGDVVPLHTHRWGGVAYVQSSSHFIRRGDKGEILFDSRKTGDPPKFPSAQWMQPLPPHTVENLGPLEIRILNYRTQGSLRPLSTGWRGDRCKRGTRNDLRSGTDVR